MLTRHQKTPIHLKSRRLLFAVFATLLVATLSFVGTFYYFNLLHGRVFQEFERFSLSANINADISRELISLELKMREIIAIVLTSPEQLPRIREELLVEFTDLKKDVSDKNIPGNKRIDTALDQYKTALDALLQHYAEMNETLLALRTFYENYTEKLKQLENTVGQLIVDAALSGKNNMGLQQNYLLFPLCVEEFLHGHMLVRSSITDNAPDLLGVGNDRENKLGAKFTTWRHLDTMEKTLGTITSAQEPIGEEVKGLLKKIPAYREQIRELHRILLTLRVDTERYKVVRAHILNSMKDIDNQTAQGIVTIHALINRLGKQETLVAMAISAIILAISLLGLAVAWRMSKALENTTREALTAKERQLTINEKLQQEMEERKMIEGELRHARDGLELRVTERTAALTAANAQLHEEIEIRLQAESNLAAEQERLAVTLRSIGDGVISTDIAGRVTLLNQIAETLTGWSQQEALGRPLQEIFPIVHEKTRVPCESPVDKVLATGGIIGLANHTLLITRDGRERQIADSGAPIRDTGGRIIGVVLVFRDVTEQSRMEEELQKIKKLESVGVLAGGIAHDFNNILAAILGNIDLALLATPQEDRIFHLLGEAKKASIRAKDLTKQLLTFSKGGTPVKETAVIGDVIKDSAIFVLHGGKISCTYHIPPDLWFVEIDKGQISQVVQNIIINACQAMPAGGTIRITCKNIAAGESPALPVHGDFVNIEIIDNGPGIPPEIIDRIFDPYFSTKEEGSGLGLAICHSIIGKHGGHLAVTSALGVGTTFSILLPAFPESEIPEAKPAREIGAPGRQGTIMIMDDDEIVRAVAATMLEFMGHGVVHAVDGRQALALYRELLAAKMPVDIIMMDLTIPGGMGGQEAVGEILKINPAAKVIVSSGYSNAPVLAHYQEYGFRAAIVKPYQFKDLKEVIEQVL